jgi:hypothetical protein
MSSASTDQIFTTGGSRTPEVPSWRHTAGSVPDKDNIEHAFAAAYESGGDTFVYFGLDRYANNGDAFVGFWFFKSAVGLNANGTFSGTHQVGDLLVLSNFTNGGAVSTIQLFEWVGSGGDTNGTLDLIATGNVCTGSPAVDKAAPSPPRPSRRPGRSTCSAGQPTIRSRPQPKAASTRRLFNGDPRFSGFSPDARLPVGNAVLMTLPSARSTTARRSRSSGRGSDDAQDFHTTTGAGLSARPD